MSDRLETQLDRQAVERLRQPERRQRLAELAAEGTRQLVRFNPTTWLDYTENEPVAAETVKELAEGGDCVDRSQLFGYARRVLDSRRGDDAVRLFTACQVWGIGTSGGGRSLNHTRDALASPQLRYYLSQAVEQVVDNSGGDLYRENRYKRLPGWGPSFATKFAYAVATADAEQRGDPAFPRALILDERVWRALNTVLGWSSWCAAGTNRWGPRYEAYVRAVHLWTHELQRDDPTVTAHTVERLLFELGERS